MRFVLALLLSLMVVCPTQAVDPLLTLMNSIVDDAEAETASTYGLVFTFEIYDFCTGHLVEGELRRSHPRLTGMWASYSTCDVLDATSSAQFLQRLIEVSPSNVQVRLTGGQTLYYGNQPAASVKGRIEGDW